MNKKKKTRKKVKKSHKGKTMKTKQIKRVPTGIPGFDKIIDGGFINGSIVLLSGNAGAGKTIFTLQFLYEGAKHYGQKGIYITTQNSVEDIVNYSKSINMDLQPLIEKGDIVVESINPNYPQLILEIVEPLVKKKNFQRFVIDSVTIMEYYIKDVFKTKNVFYKLFTTLRKIDGTSLIVSEMNKRSDDVNLELSKTGIEFLADQVVALHKKHNKGSEFSRGIEIVKMRSSGHTKMIHPYIITNKGVKVFPQEKWF